MWSRIGGYGFILHWMWEKNARTKHSHPSTRRSRGCHASGSACKTSKNRKKEEKTTEILLSFSTLSHFSTRLLLFNLIFPHPLLNSPAKFGRIYPILPHNRDSGGLLNFILILAYWARIFILA